MHREIHWKPARALLLIALASMLGAFGAEPAEGKWGKEKLKKWFGPKRSEEQVPKVGISEPSAVETEEISAQGQRPVLLISEPEQHADLSSGATLAFIEFQHIEHELSPGLTSRTTERTKSYGSDTESIVERSQERYITQVCAKQIASAIAQHLADLNRFRVVTRDHIESVLEEQYFGWSGSVNSRTAARIGHIIGADYLIYGQVQLCLSSELDLSAFLSAAVGGKTGPGAGEGGFLGDVINSFRMLRPEQLRSYVLAQIQIIHAESGKRVFTTSMAGVFEAMRSSLKYDITHRELIHWAADDLANEFIDKLLARREAQYITLYSDRNWDFDRGVDLVQLGQCASAEAHFVDVYGRFGSQMNALDISRLMYNHGVSLMCANRSEEALDRLWASLRLANDSVTFAAIEFTNDTIDKGRRIRVEDDPIIRDVETRRFSPVVDWPTAAPIPPDQPSGEAMSAVNRHSGESR